MRHAHEALTLRSPALHSLEAVQQAHGTLRLQLVALQVRGAFRRVDDAPKPPLAALHLHERSSRRMTR